MEFPGNKVVAETLVQLELLVNLDHKVFLEPEEMSAQRAKADQLDRKEIKDLQERPVCAAKTACPEKMANLSLVILALEVDKVIVVKTASTAKKEPKLQMKKVIAVLKGFPVTWVSEVHLVLLVSPQRTSGMAGLVMMVTPEWPAFQVLLVRKASLGSMALMDLLVTMARLASMENLALLESTVFVAIKVRQAR